MDKALSGIRIIDMTHNQAGLACTQILGFLAVGYDAVGKRLIAAAQDNGVAIQSSANNLLWNAVHGADGINAFVNDVTLAGVGQTAFYKNSQFLGFTSRIVLDAQGNQISPNTVDPNSGLGANVTCNGGNPCSAVVVGSWFSSPWINNSVDPTRMALAGSHVYVTQDTLEMSHVRCRPTTVDRCLGPSRLPAQRGLVVCDRRWRCRWDFRLQPCSQSARRPGVPAGLRSSSCRRPRRYREVFAHLQLKPPALVPVERWRQCVEDGKSFLAWSLGAAMITAHTDVVGSLLRPVALRKARDDWMAGRLSHAQFKSLEDRAVDEAISLQGAEGLDVVTNGEMRRLFFPIVCCASPCCVMAAKGLSLALLQECVGSAARRSPGGKKARQGKDFPAALRQGIARHTR
jgi:hypothetical protein